MWLYTSTCGLRCGPMASQLYATSKQRHVFLCERTTNIWYNGHHPLFCCCNRHHLLCLYCNGHHLLFMRHYPVDTVVTNYYWNRHCIFFYYNGHHITVFKDATLVIQRHFSSDTKTLLSWYKNTFTSSSKTLLLFWYKDTSLLLGHYSFSKTLLIFRFFLYRRHYSSTIKTPSLLLLIQRRHLHLLL